MHDVSAVETVPAAGQVTGTPRMVLRIEGLVVVIVALMGYHALGANWWLFVLLFLAPDLSFLAYLIDTRVGSIAYNAVHTYIAPLALGMVGYYSASPLLLSLGVIWLAHIGIDRAVGYGLKYRTAFGDTHLGRKGAKSVKQ
jgi:Domain of unknown function (DUF4260)